MDKRKAQERIHKAVRDNLSWLDRLPSQETEILEQTMKEADPLITVINGNTETMIPPAYVPARHHIRTWLRPVLAIAAVLVLITGFWAAQRNGFVGSITPDVVTQPAGSDETPGLPAAVVTDEIRQPEMERRRYETRGITAFRQVERHLLVYKVHHALRRCSLSHITLLPAHLLQPFLISHHAQGIVALDIFWMYLDDHSAVAPSCASVCGRHTVDDYLPWTCGGRYDESSWTHAEAIHSAPVNLSHETILGGRQVFSPPLRVVILYLVDELCGVLESYSDGYSLCLDINVG